MPSLLSYIVGPILGLALFSSFALSAENSMREPAFQENFYGVKIRRNRSWIVGYYGSILFSEDRGATWTIQQSGTRRALLHADFINDDKGWVSGSYGTVLHTENGGKSWLRQKSGTEEHLFGIDFVNERLGWAVGSRGTVLSSNEGGRTWANRSIGEDTILNSVSFVSPERGWIVGEFGVIFHSKNGGKGWIKQKSPIEVSFVSGESQNLFDLLFPNSHEGWAFGLDGIILKTRNGEQWEIAHRNGASLNSVNRHHLFGSAYFDGRLWAVGERGAVIVSEMGKGAWQKADVKSPPLSLNSIDFGPDGFGLIVGSKGLILRTLDGGKSWHRLTLHSQGAGKGLSRSQ